MNRIDRVSAILIHLQSKKLVKAQHIADRFGVSLRTVYRDIKSLEEAGVPVIGEAGSGYYLMDGYRLPPVMFTKEEAIAFLTAEKLVDKLTDAKNAENYRSAMYKIRAVLRSAEKNLLDQIDGQIEVLKTRRQPVVESDLTQTILTSIAERKTLRFRYFSFYRQELSLRTVEPVGIFHLEWHWHLIAFCLLRNDYRDFRFDRISGLNIADQPIKREHLPLKELIENRFTERHLTPVTIRINRSLAPKIADQKYYLGFVSEKESGNEMEMNFMTISLEGFARWFLPMADEAVIVEPESLRNQVRDLAQRVIKNL